MGYKKKNYPGSRIQLSIVCSVGWLVFLILWLAFFASNYTVYQNLAIVIASILMVFLLLGGVWALWGLRMVPKEGWEMIKLSGFKWRLIVSILLPFITMFFLVYWFYFQADLYTIYQNIAVFLVSFIIMGGILGLIWSRWKKPDSDMRKKFEEMGKEIGAEMEKTFNESDEK